MNNMRVMGVSATNIQRELRAFVMRLKLPPSQTGFGGKKKKKKKKH